MKPSRSIISRALFVILALAVVSACSSAPTVVPTPETIVQVQTVEVEVTRLVEVERTVEVTREVVVTQVVEQVVTATPQPTASATPTPVFVATTVPVTPWAVLTQPAPGEKVQGWSLLLVTNRSGARMDLSISGPVSVEASISDEDNWRQTIPEGDYTYTVSSEGTALYSGAMRLTNPDKHELYLYEDRANFLVP